MGELADFDSPASQAWSRRVAMDGDSDLRLSVAWGNSPNPARGIAVESGSQVGAGDRAYLVPPRLFEPLVAGWMTVLRNDYHRRHD